MSFSHVESYKNFAPPELMSFSHDESYKHFAPPELMSFSHDESYKHFAPPDLCFPRRLLQNPTPAGLVFLRLSLQAP